MIPVWIVSIIACLNPSVMSCKTTSLLSVSSPPIFPINLSTVRISRAIVDSLLLSSATKDSILSIWINYNIASFRDSQSFKVANEAFLTLRFMFWWIRHEMLRNERSLFLGFWMRANVWRNTSEIKSRGWISRNNREGSGLLWLRSGPVGGSFKWHCYNVVPWTEKMPKFTVKESYPGFGTFDLIIGKYVQ